MSPQERRKHPRYALEVLVRGVCGGVSFEGLLRDICQDAVLVESGRPCPLGASVTLFAELTTGSGEVEMTGRIIRLAPAAGSGAGLAVLFTSLTPAAATQIAFFLELQR